MATPTILVNSATGSDTAASGAGPATALSGAAAVTDGAGTTVTLTALTDLTNVDTTGLHVLYFADATAGNRNFAKITGKAGSGGATPTVTVANALGATLTKAWAIGGKRASVTSATSIKLFDNNSAAGDALPGWIVEMQSGHAESYASRINTRGNGDTTTGPITLRGTSGAATRPIITSSADFAFVPRGQYMVFKDFDVTASGGAADGFVPLANNIRYDGLRVTGFATVGFLLSYENQVVGCKITNCVIGVDASAGQNAKILGNRISGGSSHGIYAGSANYSGLSISNNLIYGQGGDGVQVNQTRADQFGSIRIGGNTIDNNTGNGIAYSGDLDTLGSLVIFNNLLTNNGAYGLKFLDSETAANLSARGTVILGNNSYNNTSGASLPASIITSDPGLNPSYTNTGTGDYTPTNASLAGKGYPAAFLI